MKFKGLAGNGWALCFCGLPPGYHGGEFGAETEQSLSGSRLARGGSLVEFFAFLRIASRERVGRRAGPLGSIFAPAFD
jgi:hypothetical protein